MKALELIKKYFLDHPEADEAIVELEAWQSKYDNGQLQYSKLWDMYSDLKKQLEPKSCDLCKHREDYCGEFTCKYLDDMVNTPPQEPYGIYLQDAYRLCCINYEPKEDS